MSGLECNRVHLVMRSRRIERLKSETDQSETLAKQNKTGVFSQVWTILLRRSPQTFGRVSGGYIEAELTPMQDPPAPSR